MEVRRARPAGADPHRQIVGEDLRTPPGRPPPDRWLPVHPSVGAAHRLGQERPGRAGGPAAQAARLCRGGHVIELQSPRLVKKADVWPMVPTTTKSYPGISGESELLHMDLRRQGSEL
jgi:hypothetical protein